MQPRFLGSNLPRLNQVGDDGIVASQQAKATAAQEVHAAVTDIADCRHIALANQH
jgi:hypothetical protein